MRGLNPKEFAVLAEIIDGRNADYGFTEDDLVTLRALARRGLVVLTSDIVRPDGTFTVDGTLTLMGMMIYRACRPVQV